MFKKSEESEWTRFSRALGGNTPAAPPEDELAPEPAGEAVTLAQMPPPPTAPEPVVQTYSPPPPPVDSEPVVQTYSPPVQASAPYRPATRLAEPESDETIVGDGATIDGTVRSDRSIRVRGAVQGEIESQQRVVVDESARVQARITAEEVVILGELNGAINCSGRVEIASTARVTGEVTAGTLVIQEGAFFEGSLKMATARDGA